MLRCCEKIFLPRGMHRESAMGSPLNPHHSSDNMNDIGSRSSCCHVSVYVRHPMSFITFWIAAS